MITAQANGPSKHYNDVALPPLPRGTQTLIGRAQYHLPRVLQEEHALEAPIRNWVLVRAKSYWVLFAMMDEYRIGGMLHRYLAPTITHDLSTLLKIRVIPCNSMGLGYAFILKQTSRLPTDVPFSTNLPGNDLLPFGIDANGPIVVHPEDVQNLIIVGAQRSGKSTFLKALVHSARLYGWMLYLADPQDHTFPRLIWDKFTAHPVAGSQEELGELLGHVEAQMSRRQALFTEAAQSAVRQGLPPKDLEQYNAIVAPDKRLPRALIVIDEANSYLVNKHVTTRLFEIARMGRKWGLQLAIAGHSFRANDVPKSLSSMLQTRISFQVGDPTSAEVVLSSAALGRQAMKIEHKGRGIMRLGNKPVQFQAFHLTEEIEFELLRQAKLDVGSPLTELEQALVEHAVSQLDRAFTIGKLWQTFRDQTFDQAGQRAPEGQGGKTVSHHRVDQIAQRFAQKGWLTSPKDATSARMVTPELARLAGSGRTGVQTE